MIRFILITLHYFMEACIGGKVHWKLEADVTSVSNVILIVGEVLKSEAM